MLEAIVMTFGCSLLFVPAVHRYAAHTRPELLADLAQIGATLLIAFAVETSWSIKASRTRGADHESWVGIGAGLGLCGIAGVGFALVLSGDWDGTPSLVQDFAFGWSVISLGLLGLVVGSLPAVLYEWSHAVHTEYPDE